MPRDLNGVCALLASRGWDDGLDADRGPVYVAIDKAVVGCLQVVEASPDEAVLDVLLVAERSRRRGIGTQLVDTAMADHPHELYAACRDDAVSFYRSLGFRPIPEGLKGAPHPVRACWKRMGNRAPIAMVNDRTSW